jgi:uncharacterized Ntn-hydrolase superfamily protein
VTYSIVARDPASGAFGVAVQSAYFSVGGVVPWVEDGVGAVATQAMGEVSYGRLGLQRMRDGEPAGDALAALLAADDDRETRQVALVDRESRVAVHTGERCTAYAGARTGDGWSVQANMMRHDTVPDAMADAYTGTTGDFLDRLLAALDAAEAAGGDVRGQQAAALVVSTATGPYIRLHVEDHPQPLVELRRLVQMHRGFEVLSDAFDRLQQGDVEGLLPALEQALELAPDSKEIRFRLAAARTLFGDPRGRVTLDEMYAENPGWRELIPRLAAVGMLPDIPGVVEMLS